MKILIDVPPFAPGLRSLQNIPEVKVECLNFPELEAPARELDPARIADFDGLFCTFPPLNHALMSRLQWIQISSTGYEQLIGQGFPARGITCTNGSGCFDVPIAEWNIGMMIALTRNFRQLIRNQDGAIWDDSGMFQREMRGLTVGFWGYGGIARETARLARQMGLQVHALTRNGSRVRHDVYQMQGTGDPEGVMPHRLFKAGEELAFLAGLDFLVVCVPLTNATRGMIGERELRALPSKAFVLNPARGPIIAEQALLQALREKWIAGAALDTHYYYPLPKDHPLWRFPNVVLTPHISGSGLSPHFEERLWEIFVENVGRRVRGEPLLNVLSPGALAGK